MKTKEKITINDVADALGVSKTTVSRAISGKGRIGAETRNRVLEYIKKHHYTPNVIAKSLVESRTFNIAFVIPSDCKAIDLPFFQKCLFGITETAEQLGYDVIVNTVNSVSDISSLERLLDNHKVDGLILGRTAENDPAISYLKENKMPFVTIGTTNVQGVVQIDNDHIGACRELTTLLLLKGISKLGLIGGNRRFIVNQKRYEGFLKAHEEMQKKIDPGNVCLDVTNRAGIDRAVDDLLENGVQCIICMDDYICQQVLDKLLKDKLLIPEDIKVASFYDSALKDIAGFLNNVTSVYFDPMLMGSQACRKLIDLLEEKTVDETELLGYQILLRHSTQN